MRPAADIEGFREAVAAVFPDLADARYDLLTAGWDCVAVDVDDRLIFRFPRHDAAAAALVREAALLAVVAPAVSLPVPVTEIHPGPPLFSRHVKLAGEHLLPAQYDALPDAARARLAGDMAAFFAGLHRLDPATLAAAGAVPAAPWHPAEVLVDRAVPALPAALRPRAERLARAWDVLTPDPLGEVFGYFDGHGWNMAFDHARGRLNGVYDFGDSGIGPLHREFVYPSLLAPELAWRVVDAYEAVAGRALDRARIRLLTGVHRLSELADYPDDPRHTPTMVGNFAAWAAPG